MQNLIRIYILNKRITYYRRQRELAIDVMIRILNSSYGKNPENKESHKANIQWWLTHRRQIDRVINRIEKLKSK